MAQLYWTIFTTDQWSAKSVDEWDTFLLEPNGLTATITAQSDPAGAAVLATVAHHAAIAAQSLPATASVTVDVISRTKTVGIGAASGPAQVVANVLVSTAARITALSGQASTLVTAQRGAVVNVLAQSGPAIAGTPTTVKTVDIAAQSGPASTLITATDKKTIACSVVAQSGDAATFISGGSVVVVSAIMIESLRALSSSFDALHSPVSITMMMQNSNNLARITGTCHAWAVKRSTNEIDLFLDDREITIDVGRYA